ncbi:hypothetical protein K505DRAFT_322900 [Melanomma pulvis-pyrius CBS 109.77]|uniref:Uncharacterized protein n=1 Tax=Melanomma pulvis-pyrius CBS 109.77 TaxID=1314802 RepID=A0A6A6XKV8_9PLEO|nr:hypothetical protein K505DRAFT_322900 [Melanomma pulvis-pyrius CBS 109.77]
MHPNPIFAGEHDTLIASNPQHGSTSEAIFPQQQHTAPTYLPHNGGPSLQAVQNQTNPVRPTLRQAVESTR